MPKLEFVKKFVVKKILMSLKISCEFEKNECEKSLDPGTMEVHKKEYKFRTIDSSLPCGSKIIISYHGLTKHLAKAHESCSLKCIEVHEGLSRIFLTHEAQVTKNYFKKLFHQNNLLSK